MPALTVEGLGRIREDAQKRHGLEGAGVRARVAVHLGTCGLAAGGMPVLGAFGNEVRKRGLRDVQIVTTGCAGLCSAEPMATVEVHGSAPVSYGHLTAETAAQILEEHVVGGRVASRHALDTSIPFFSRQTRVVLGNAGTIDPESFDDYVAREGYAALAKALVEMTPEAVVAEVTASGLRGRGGAGFPTGRKWAACRAEARSPRYVIGNCDEGDPGAYMDRSLLESDPHAVVEGATIAAYAVGAAKGFVYIRTEYPLAIQRLRTAIGQARERGLLGRDVLGSGFPFDLEIREGSGAFVCGEETSLIRSIEGAIPEPRPRPPFPVQSGLWGQPTLINNVETLANVPPILRRGAAWFAGLGAPRSAGTKIFSLVGKITNSGLIEVPMGITLREIVEEIGGGIPGGKSLKAVQTGGPSGGCIPGHLADVPIDYESLGEVGSIMGSGGMIVMDEDTCVVDVARFFLQFTNDESCGKCSSCREGSAALLEVLTRVAEGQGREGDLEFLEELAGAVKDASMCGLGKTLPNPVLSTLRYFREEYEAHVREGRCPALVCRGLIKYTIDPDLCPGCTACLDVCSGEAIRGSTKHVHVIDQAKCTKCGQCLEVCPPKVHAVRKVTGPEAQELASLHDPVPVAEWRRRRAGEATERTAP